MNPTTTEPSTNALTARQEIGALYTPLDEAVEELHRRRQDPQLCARVEEFHRPLSPTFIPAKPFGVLFRHIFTPNYEFERFIEITQKAELRPLGLEFHQDLFFNWNPDKYRLCRPAFATRPNHVRCLRLVDFNQMQGRCLNKVMTINGWGLAHFHHALLGHAHSESGLQITDFSTWFLQGRATGLFYLHYLALFICHGILFENFVADDKSELRFAREKVIPSFAQALKLFGVRPLIVPLLPLKSEGSDHWRCLPGSLYPYAVELLRTKP